MNDAREHSPPDDPVEPEAAAWVLRSDRGLTPAEPDAYSEWLAADPRHRAAIARLRRHWSRLDQLAEWRPEHGTRPNPDLLAPPPRARIVPLVRWTLPLAAAAALVTGWIAWRPAATVPAEGARTSELATTTAPATAPATNQRVLPDGTIVELNRGARLTVDFSPTLRRVVLEDGEAHFAVVRDAARPFVVCAGGIDVRAVGTAFNVRVASTEIEVLVTEGRVQLEQTSGPVSAAAAPQIATLTVGEIARVLAWQHRLLDFTAAPLTEIVAEFNRRNPVQLVVIDPELAAVRVSATLRSDNIDGFVRLLEAGFGARAERRGEAEILLRAAK
jgi:transmembrane sensor